MRDEAIAADCVAAERVGVAAAVGVECALHRAVRCIRERLGDGVDRTGDSLRAVEQSLAAFDPFNALDHVRGQCVNGSCAVTKAIADTDTVDEPEDFVGARALE